MPKVKFLDKNNNHIETVEVPEDTTVMEAARFYSKNEYIEGIDAICGGSCVCGTCHVYLTDDWLKKIDPIDEETPERSVLEYNEKYNEKYSRCGCQMVLFDRHDGIVVKIP